MQPFRFLLLLATFLSCVSAQEEQKVAETVEVRPDELPVAEASDAMMIEDVSSQEERQLPYKNAKADCKFLK